MRRSALPVLALLLSACTLVPWWASVNRDGRDNATVAAVTLSADAFRDGMFVGLALSGGGSRAANFGAAVMLELAELGALDRVDAISSVSGGSLAAAYYMLQGERGIAFTRREVDARFARDFQLRWLVRWFDPRNALRYWFTAFDRSDIMVQVFDANLFHGATFADLGRRLVPRPSLLINASNAVNGRKFVFANEEFNRLGSDLASYPVARAVMASGAFPAAFASVTLRDYRTGDDRRYVHLFDGGPIDNLGIGTLVKVLQNHLAKRYLDDAPAAEPAGAPPDLLRRYGLPRGCLMISVDAYTDTSVKARRRARLDDLRPWYGFLVDPNLNDATGDLLAVKRSEALHLLGLDSANRDALGSFPIFGPNLDDDELPNLRGKLARALAQRTGHGAADRYVVDELLRRAGSCHLWHVTLSQLRPSTACPLGELVNGVGTAYKVSKGEQCGLFAAARTLVRAMWREFGLDGLMRDGFPTAGPIPGAPLRIREPRLSLDCGLPETVAEDGREVCRISLTPPGSR